MLLIGLYWVLLVRETQAHLLLRHRVKSRTSFSFEKQSFDQRPERDMTCLLKRKGFCIPRHHLPAISTARVLSCWCCTKHVVGNRESLLLLDQHIEKPKLEKLKATTYQHSRNYLLWDESFKCQILQRVHTSYNQLKQSDQLSAAYFCLCNQTWISSDRLKLSWKKREMCWSTWHNQNLGP